MNLNIIIIIIYINGYSYKNYWDIFVICSILKCVCEKIYCSY